MAKFILVFAFCSVAFFQDHAFAMGQRRIPSEKIDPPPAGPVLEHGELKLKVLSYNIHGIPIPGSDTDHFGAIGQALAERRKAGTAPQIVALQEGFHQAVGDLINLSGYPYHKSGPGPNWPRTGSGLIILSEYPILEYNSMVYALENSAGMDWNAEKGIEYLKIRLPGLEQPLEFLDTHMQADYDDFIAPLDETIAARRRQIVELARFFRNTVSSDGPVLFPGDFNTNTTVGDYYEILARTPLTDAAESCGVPGACRVNIDPIQDRAESVDHQFFRSGSAVKIEPIEYNKVFRKMVLSDHEGLEVEYRISW